MRARSTARGQAWDVDGLPTLSSTALRALARAAALPGLEATRGPWRDGAPDRQRLRVTRPASPAWRDHRAAARSLGLTGSPASGAPARAQIVLDELRRAGAGATFDDAPSTLRAGARLARALGLVPDEVVVTGDVSALVGAEQAQDGSACAEQALAAAAGAPVRRRRPQAPVTRARLWALDRLGRAWLMAAFDAAAGASVGAVVDPGVTLQVALEHLGGALPAWLSPEQVRVLPVGGADTTAAQALAARLLQGGVRAHVDHAGPLSARVGAATAARVPYLAFVGPDEVASGELRVRPRGARTHATLSQAAFVARVTDEVRERSPELTLGDVGTRCAASPGDDPADGRPVDHHQRVQKERLPSANR